MELMHYYDSDCTDFYETTYSEDERFGEFLRQTKLEDAERLREADLAREIHYSEWFQTLKDSSGSIFNLPGLHILKFSHKRIKFSFQPCRVAKYVSERVMFYISLRYRKGYWLLKRDSLPANYKAKIYNLFHTDGWFRYRDENIDSGICDIYIILKEWAIDEDKYRRQKFKRYRNGEDIYIDRDDEDLFLSDSEIEKLHQRRQEIWNRMLPPTTKGPKTRRHALKIRLRLSSSSTDS